MSSKNVRVYSRVNFLTTEFSEVYRVNSTRWREIDCLFEMETTTTVASVIKPIKGRHIPYLENREFLIQDDIILLIDKLGK